MFRAQAMNICDDIRLDILAKDTGDTGLISHSDFKDMLVQIY